MSEGKSPRPPLGARVHHALVRGIVHNGFAPTHGELAEVLGATPAEIDAALRELERGHGLVLHPGTTDVWIVHPFSLSPTAVWVAAGERGFWAPCVWCASGIVALAAATAEIHARLGGEGEPVVVRVQDGRLVGDELVVHFALPPRDAWTNVVHYCATVLPFRREADVPPWCARHRLPQGAVVPFGRVLELGRAWYCDHLKPDWTKWSAREAQAIFASVGLTGDFWSLPVEGDRPF